MKIVITLEAPNIQDKHLSDIDKEELVNELYLRIADNIFLENEDETEVEFEMVNIEFKR